MQTDTRGVIQNSKVADSNGKIIFENNILCSQFLRDYIELPYLKDVQPEDIEDVSEQFVPLFSEERNAERVKKVRIRKEHPFFVVSLIEHKSSVDYDVSMQIFRYMVYIWEAYAKEAEKLHKGVTKLADFKYPPVLPIVYYEGTKKWTVPYAFRNLPAEKVEEILKETPEHLLDIISNILRAFLFKMNLSEDEAEALVGKVKEKKMGYLFEDMTLDIQAIRREAAEEKAQANKARECALEAEERAMEAEERASKAEERANKAEERANKANECANKANECANKANERANKANERAIQFAVETCQEFAATREQTINKVVEKFGLPKAVAEEKVDAYWK